MSGPWLDDYDRVSSIHNEGSPYAGPDYYNYKPIALLHMTVSMGLSRSYAGSHPYPPHTWYNVYNGDKFQTVRLDRAAKALYQPQYGYHWTNKHTDLLQCELIGVPVVNQRTYTEAQCKLIGENVLAPWQRYLWSVGKAVNLNNVRQHTNSSGSASEYWGGRMAEQEMADFDGVMAHIDTWGNDHWDCSVEWLQGMAQFAQAALGLHPGTVVKETKIYNLKCDRWDAVVVTEDGNVWQQLWAHDRADAPLVILPANQQWSNLGGPPNGGAKDVALNWDGDWFNVLAVGKDGSVWKNANHPASGWTGWQSMGGGRVVAITTASKYSIQSS